MPLSRRLLASIAALVALPIGLEWVVAYIKNENFSFGRAAAALGVVAVALLLLGILRVGTKRVTLMLEFAVVVLGLATAGSGILGLASGREAIVNWSFVVVVCLGVLITASGIYAIYLEKTGGDFIFAAQEEVGSRVGQQFNDSQGNVLLTKFASFSDSDEEVATLCLRQMSPTDVHFVAYYVNGACRFYLDVLDSPVLNRFFRGFGRDERRSAYEKAGRQLSWIVTRLDSYCGDWRAVF